VFAHRVFFGFIGLEDRSKHKEYNEWHQLDHLPENLVLPGVAWGDRWVRSPDCVAAGTAPDPAHADHDYAVMYWFREPADASIAAWRELNESSVHWGRRPELAWARRRPVGFFVPVKGYVHPRVLVSPEALPFRPHRGVHVTLTRVTSPESPDAVEHFKEYDRVRMPQLLECPGVAGAWTFRYAGGSGGLGAGAATAPAGSGAVAASGTMVLRLLYLDGDPIETSALMAQRESAWADAARPSARPRAEELLFTGPLRSIVPWEWDWFDRS